MGDGAKWLKADLHVHAPGIGQYFTMPSGEQVPSTDEDRFAFARRYVERAHKEAGLDLIAITNHNDTAWINPLRRAAQELYGDKFVVLPGLEVGADSGLNSIHVLAIFPRKTTVETLERLLDDDLEFSQKPRFTSDGAPLPSPKSFSDTLRAIKKRGGVAIAAHAFSSEDSLLDSSSNKGVSRRAQFLLEELKGLDLASFTLEQLAQKQSRWGFWLVTNQHQDVNFRRSRPIALFNSSDARQLEDIGRRYTWFKADHPRFQALTSALLDPEDRLRLNDAPPEDVGLLPQERRWMYMPPIMPARYLDRLKVADTSSGFLCKLAGSFSPGLNCLIGGRGTGKSAIIELIRYLWGQRPLSGKWEGFEDVFLPETGEASLEVVMDNTCYRVVRCGRQEPYVERREVDGTWMLVPDLLPDDLITLHIYGQKEILRTSEDVRSQLDLLDRLVGNQLDYLKREQSNLQEELRQNREKVLGKYRELRKLRAQLKERPKIEEQLKRYHKLGIGEMAEVKRKYDREGQNFQKAKSQLGEINEALEKAASEVQIDLSYLDQEQISELINPETLKQLRLRVEKLVDELANALGSSQAQVQKVQQDVERIHADWRVQSERFAAKYQKALAKLPDVTPSTVINMEKRLAELDGVAEEAKDVEGDIKEVLNQRRELLANLLDNAKTQYQIRQQKAEELSARLSRIRLNVTAGGNSQSLISQLRAHLSGSRMRDTHYKAIAQKAGPSLIPILAAVEQADSETTEDNWVYQDWLPSPEPRLIEGESLPYLAEVSGLDDAGWAGKLVDYLDFETRLILDEFVTPDSVIIEVNIARDGQSDNWRALGRALGQGVSVGQGCTAILSIILLESENPLVIDQPEDDLDNRFIYDEVVQILRRERNKRQIIVATHNANVPVAGDAEMIIALDTQEEVVDGTPELRCQILAAGFVDNEEVCRQVTLLLEGGEEAFRLRYQKYGF